MWTEEPEQNFPSDGKVDSAAAKRKASIVHSGKDAATLNVSPESTMAVVAASPKSAARARRLQKIRRMIQEGSYDVPSWKLAPILLEKCFCTQYQDRHAEGCGD